MIIIQNKLVFVNECDPKARRLESSLSKNWEKSSDINIRVNEEKGKIKQNFVCIPVSSEI